MKVVAALLVLTPTLTCAADDAWTSTAAHIDPANDYGVTVANGVVGLVSSPEPLKVKDVVLGGAFDNYGGRRVDARGIAHFTQKRKRTALNKCDQLQSSLVGVLMDMLERPHAAQSAVQS